MQAAPQAPARPTTPEVTVRQGRQTITVSGAQPVIAGSEGAQTINIPLPRTAADIEALKARREELSNQLQSVDGRRSKLMSQLKQTGDATAVQGLEARLSLLDARQLQLESDLAQTGQMLSSPGAGLIASTSAPPVVAGLNRKEIMTVSILSIVLVLFPIAIGIGRAIFRRASRPGLAPAVFSETAQRLERLEASVDSIAIEIERVSEGQRFVTKLLSDSQPAPMIGAGQRTPEIVRGS